MPGFDGTGPRGQGPMTGGARGFCNPAQAGYRPQYGYGYGYGRGFGRGGRGFGRGFGPGYGRGRFWGWGAYPVAGRVPSYGASYPMSDTQEVEMLRGEAESIKGALEQINQRISELEKKETQD